MTSADPVSVTDIARRIGVTPDAIRKWRTRHDAETRPFPLPAWTVAGGAAWNWPDVQAWLRATGRPSEPVVVELVRGEAPGSVGADYGRVGPLASLDDNSAVSKWLDAAGYGPDEPDLWLNLVPADAWAPNNTPTDEMTVAVTLPEMERIRAQMEES